jgi:ketosteroid isomerase-like protein
MRILLLLLLAVSLRGSAFAQTSTDDANIRIILANQVNQWNRGNIDGYMVGYWENDSLIFIGKNGPTYGYKATLDRYRLAYPDLTRMGQLTSTVIKVRLLSPEWAYVTGQWQLKRTVGDLGGYYTLLLRKINGEWVIVEDHSS